jgi:hypothetical protein
MMNWFKPFKSFKTFGRFVEAHNPDYHLPAESFC